MIEYSLGSLSAEIEEAVARLFPDDAVAKNSARLKWRFRDGPHGDGFFALARDGGRGGTIIGLIGLIALRLRSEDRTGAGVQSINSVQAVDVIVETAYRGRGVFAGLGAVAIEGAAQRGKQVLWGFPNASAAPAWFGRFSWQRFGTLPFLIRPLRTGYFFKRLSPRLQSVDIALVRTRSEPDPDVMKIERFGPEADRLWQRFAPTGCAVDRDSAFLNWRLIDCPGSSYRIVTTVDQEGEIVALVASTVVNRHGGLILYVMEAMSRDRGALAKLLRHELALAANQGADAALSWCPPISPARQAYRRAGFLPFPEGMRPLTMHFGAKALHGDVPDVVRDGNSWFLSYLDSDTI